jgi:hypothetical protein
MSRTGIDLLQFIGSEPQIVVVPEDDLNARRDDLPHAKRDWHSDRMSGQGREQFLDELAPLRLSLRCVGTCRAVGQLNERDHGDGDVGISRCAGDGREHLTSILSRALGFDQNAGIEDRSHAGGSSGSRWLSMAASTSLAKSASMTAVESSGKSAMDSEMVRRSGDGAWITATGKLPLSITTSAPARTRASTSAKLLAASASEM